MSPGWKSGTALSDAVVNDLDFSPVSDAVLGLATLSAEPFVVVELEVPMKVSVVRHNRPDNVINIISAPVQREVGVRGVNTFGK